MKNTDHTAERNESDGNYRSKCPIDECEHQLIGLSDEDEWTDLLDKHLRENHNTTLYDWYETPDSELHWEAGVAEESRVYCPISDKTFGPGGESSCQDYCVYCGEDTDNDSHRPHEYDIFCENSTMSNFRFCPNCGERIDRDLWPESNQEEK